MRNLLISEYLKLLSEQAARWGADRGADVSSDPKWTCPLNTFSATIRLELAGGDHWVPRVIIGSSPAVTGDPASVLVQLEAMAATLRRAVSAYTVIEPVRVWVGEAPCDYCDGRGESQGYPCSRCGGEGVRKEAGEADEED